VERYELEREDQDGRHWLSLSMDDDNNLRKKAPPYNASRLLLRLSKLDNSPKCTLREMPHGNASFPTRFGGWLTFETPRKVLLDRLPVCGAPIGHEG
ncbi:MAG: hypothetical protein LC740_03865, partial [Actinobacteria bacterium]|nr:hypothetical protein [Actinomycetota bacterium]